ncbi:hypothetical protein Q3G72_033131 [Acer saccharum]|nr:hypothetical protein Q3G72_033131 [Acer saccharum]
MEIGGGENGADDGDGQSKEVSKRIILSSLVVSRRRQPPPIRGDCQRRSNAKEISVDLLRHLRKVDFLRFDKIKRRSLLNGGDLRQSPPIEEDR